MARVDNYEQRFGGIGRLYTPEGLGAFASDSCNALLVLAA